MYPYSLNTLLMFEMVLIFLNYSYYFFVLLFLHTIIYEVRKNNKEAVKRTREYNIAPQPFVSAPEIWRAHLETCFFAPEISASALEAVSFAPEKTDFLTTYPVWLHTG